MNTAILNSADTGLDVLDIKGNVEFAARRLHVRDTVLHMEGMHRLARAFVEQPETMLQELVDVAVDVCGADSAGISVVKDNPTDVEYFHWVATAGQYSRFTNAILPVYPSACSLCLERSRPQHFRVRQPFFDLMGIEAPLITDGILLPWRAGETRGTIFVMAHGRTEAFDQVDCTRMEVLADFAAMAIRQQRQQKQLLAQERAAAAGAMANDLAHKINNPLQSLTNILYLAAQGYNGEAAKAVGQQALGDLESLSALVTKLLALPRYGTQ
jgi:signal transduction histidine kinase